MEVDLAAVAALIADPSRAAMLNALFGGEPVTAGELARRAGVAPSTTTGHLARLEAGGLVVSARDGRTRRVRLAGPEVARALEALAAIAPPARPRGLKEWQHGEALRGARSCYDHLAGVAGVALADALVARGVLEPGEGAFAITARGEDELAAFGLDVAGDPRRAPGHRAGLPGLVRAPAARRRRARRGAARRAAAAALAAPPDRRPRAHADRGGRGRPGRRVRRRACYDRHEVRLGGIPPMPRLLETARESFWILALAVIVLFAFFVALGAFAPGDVLWVTLLVVVLCVLWIVHATLSRRRTRARPVGRARARAARLLSRAAGAHAVRLRACSTTRSSRWST